MATRGYRWLFLGVGESRSIINVKDLCGCWRTQILRRNHRADHASFVVHFSSTQVGIRELG